MSSNPISMKEEHFLTSIVGGELTPAPEQLAPAIKAKDLAKLLHDNPVGAALSAAPQFTGGAKSAQDVNADNSYVLRQFFGNRGIGVVGKDGALFSAMGTTTSFNSIMGAIAAKGAYDRYQRAKQIGCGVFSHERVESGIDTVRGVIQSIAGSAYIPYRPLSMTTSILGVGSSSFAAPTILGRVTYSLGTIGSGLFGIFYGCLSLFFASNTTRLANFYMKMRKAGSLYDLKNASNDQKIVEFLKDKLAVTPSTTLEQIQKTNKNDLGTVKRELKKAAVDSTRRFIKETLKEAVEQKVPGISKRSEKECKEMAEHLFAEFDKMPDEVKQELCQGLITRLNLHEEQAQGLSFVELLGLDIKTSLRSKRDEAELTGYIGAAAVSSLKKGMETDLIGRLVSEDTVVHEKALEEAEGLIKNALSSMRGNAFISVGLLFAGIVGIIGTIMNFIPAVANLAVTGAIWLACGVFMLPVDAYCLYGAQSSEGPVGKYDKTLLYVSTILGAASVVATVLMASVFSMGIPAFVIALVIGVLWIGVNCYSIGKLEEKEKKYEMDHPTLEGMAKKLEQEILAKGVTESLAGKKMDPSYNRGILERLKATAKNLSKEDRKALKADFARLQGIKDPGERQSLRGRHGLVLSEVTTIDLQRQKGDLQKELQDCLIHAPCPTLAILEEMGGLEGLDKLCDALKAVIKDRSEASQKLALDTFNTLHPEVKTLIDKKISLVYGYGEIYFDQHIAHADVFRAVEKAFEGNRSSKELSALYDYLCVIGKKGTDEQLIRKAKELFGKLSLEDKGLVSLTIYHKKAKKASSRCFTQADDVPKMQKALQGALKGATNPVTVKRINVEHRLRILPLSGV